MLRRRFLSLIAGLACLAGWLAGCRRSPEPDACPVLTESPPPGDELPLAEPVIVAFVRDRIARQLPTATRFDPLLLLAIVGFVLRLLQVCRTAAILRQQSACGRRPDGPVARRIRARLHDRFAADHPEISDAAIDEQVDAALRAFVEAPTAELLRVKQSLDLRVKEPTRVELFEFVQDLSREQ